MNPIFRFIRVFVAAAAVISAAAVLCGQGSQTALLNDPIARLQKQIELGEVKLDYSSNGWGYLPSLLKHLDLNIDSQILVFSKTSFQISKISPQTPRALFFNDSVAVGSVQDGKVFEFTSLDPSQGIVFYTMDTEKTERRDLNAVRRMPELPRSRRSCGVLCVFHHRPAPFVMERSSAPIIAPD
jgi:hypothetical protein